MNMSMGKVLILELFSPRGEGAQPRRYWENNEDERVKLNSATGLT